MIKVGTCGFPVSREKYWKVFKVVEVQKTFYTEMSEKLAKKWRDIAPETFEFALKAPQTITHEMKSPTYRRYRGFPGKFGRFRVNEDTMRSWARFIKIAKILRSKIIILQSPPSFSENGENVKNIYDFFSVVEKGFIYGWEPRGKWSIDSVRKICNDLHLIHVVDPFKGKSTAGDFRYYRLHGIGGYRYKYSNEELSQLTKIVKDGDYVMFNNTAMWNNAKTFIALINGHYKKEEYGETLNKTV